ncbi:MAG: alpha-galactosidase, partial [Candidatus Helarchaeales archaeon]
MANITLEEKDSQVIISNGVVSIEFNLATGMYSIINEKIGKAFIRNAIARFIFIKNENPDSEEISFSSAEDFDSSWKLEDLESKDGKLGKKLRVIFKKSDDVPSFHVEFTLLVKSSTVFIKMAVNNDTKSTFRLKELHPLYISQEHGGVLDFGSNLTNWRLFKTDWQSWSKAKVQGVFEKDKTTKLRISRLILNSNPDEKRKKGLIIGEMFLAIYDKTLNSTLICGFVTLKDQFCQIMLKTNKKQKSLEFLSARSQADEILVEPGEIISSEKLGLFFDPDKNEIELLTDYFNLVALENDAKTWPSIPKGWCSWYHYYQNISEQETIKNLEFISAHADDIPVDFFQLDDGYQIRAGEWEANPKFPSGLASLASRINEHGYIAGIWTAPFFVSNKSKLIKQHPEWFLKDSRDKLIVAGLEGFENTKYRYLYALTSCSYALDCTHPEALQFLKNLFVKLKEWGFRYFKIDFLYAAALEAKRNNPKLTRAQAYRKGLETIRSAVGDDSFILGCGAPLGPAIGIVNGMRVSTDTAPSWNPLIRKLGIALLGLDNLPSVVSAMHNDILLSMMHEKLWINDPDCLMIRDHDTSLTEEEVRTQISIIGLTNGIYMLSDDFSHVSAARISLIKKFAPLPIKMNPAVPLDLFDSTPSKPPSLFGTRIETSFDTWWIIAVINWEDRPKDIELKFNKLGLSQDTRYHVHEFWSDKYLGIHENQITLEKIPKHACRLICIREVKNKPQVLSTSFHFTQGAEFETISHDDSSNTLNLKIERKGKNAGTIAIWVPDEMTFTDIETNAKNHDMTTENENILKIKLEFKDEC